MLRKHFCRLVGHAWRPSAALVGVRACRRCGGYHAADLTAYHQTALLHRQEQAEVRWRWIQARLDEAARRYEPEA
jgi:hypothetical protein